MAFSSDKTRQGAAGAGGGATADQCTSGAGL